MLCGEPAPMDMARAQEVVEGILGKGDSTTLEAHLHEGRGRAKAVEEDAQDGEATEFVGTRKAQDTTDVVTSE